jgi:hypothetical protein
MSLPRTLPDKVTRLLPVKLSQEALNVAGNECGNNIEAKEKLKLELSETSKRFKDDIAGLEAEITRLGHILSTKCEEREVECVQIVSGDRVLIVRSDTEEEVGSRDLTDKERQYVLDFSSAPE